MPLKTRVLHLSLVNMQKSWSAPHMTKREGGNKEETNISVFARNAQMYKHRHTSTKQTSEEFDFRNSSMYLFIIPQVMLGNFYLLNCLGEKNNPSPRKGGVILLTRCLTRSLSIHWPPLCYTSLVEFQPVHPKNNLNTPAEMDVDEWAVSHFGKVIGRGWGSRVRTSREEILMKLQNGLIDLCGCMLQRRDAERTDASRLVSEGRLKDNESHCQETWPSQHMKPTEQQTALHGSKPRAPGNSSSANIKKERN